MPTLWKPKGKWIFKISNKIDIPRNAVGKWVWIGNYKINLKW